MVGFKSWSKGGNDACECDDDIFVGGDAWIIG